MNNEWE